MKVVQVNEWTPKQFLNPTETKNSPLWPKKVQNNNPKIKSKLNVRIKGNKENKSFCTI